MKSTNAVISICLGFVFLTTVSFSSTNEVGKVDRKEFTLKQIGAVHVEGETTTIVMDKDVEPALLGLDGFSHVLVFWWFDNNDTPKKRKTLQVHPRGNKKNPLTGIFACRCPMRPNLIALTLCKIISVKGNVVEVDNIDAFDGTPVLDLKGYLPGYDSVEGASAPTWRFNK